MSFKTYILVAIFLLTIAVMRKAETAPPLQPPPQIMERAKGEPEIWLCTADTKEVFYCLAFKEAKGAIVYVFDGREITAVFTTPDDEWEKQDYIWLRGAI